MAYGDFLYLARRKASDTILTDKAFSIAKTQNMMEIREVLLQCFINSLIKRLQVVVLNLCHKMSN